MAKKYVSKFPEVAQAAQEEATANPDNVVISATTQLARVKGPGGDVTDVDILGISYADILTGNYQTTE